MIRWLWSRLIKWGWDYGHVYNFDEPEDSIPLSITESNEIDMDKAVRIAVLPAKGGCVVETKTFDKKNHNWITEAHIVAEGDDVAHRVGQIVAMELLRR
jgi:hypothetical protein